MRRKLMVLVLAVAFMLVPSVASAHHATTCNYWSPQYYSIQSSVNWNGNCHCGPGSRVVVESITQGFGFLDSTGHKLISATYFGNTQSAVWNPTEFDNRVQRYTTSHTIVENVSWGHWNVFSGGDMRVRIHCGTLPAGTKQVLVIS